MSANNELRIAKTEAGWMIADVDVDCLGSHFVQEEPVKTLEEAIAIANKYMETNEVEYGLNIILGGSKK